MVASKKTYKPVFIAEIFKQGSRTPMKDPLNITEFENLGQEKLLQNGLRQHYILGKQLAKNYQEIFSRIKFPLLETTIYSSNLDTCILSSQAHLLGIFGDKTGHNITRSDNRVTNPPFQGFNVPDPKSSKAVGSGYLPFQFKISNDTRDLIFMNDPNSACPFFELNITRDHQKKIREFQKMEITIMKILESRLRSGGFTSEEIFGKEYFDFEEIVELWDSITSYKAYFGKAYGDIDEYLYKNLTALTTINGTLFFEDSYMKLFTTRITEAIIDAMNTFRHSSHPIAPLAVKYMAFSGKDHTILPFLIALNLTSSECLKNAIFSGFDDFECKFLPQYASNLIFELNLDESNDLYVRMLYNGEPIDICHQDKFYCELDKFVYFATEYLIESSFDSLCTGEVEDYVKTAAFFIINCVIVGAIIVLSKYISSNRSKVIKIGGVDRLVEVFSDSATMKNVVKEYRGETLSAVDEVLEVRKETRDLLADPLFRSVGSFNDLNDGQSIHSGKNRIESDRERRDVLESRKLFKRKLTLDDKFPNVD